MTLRLSNPDADVFVPDGLPGEPALARTTHMCIAAHQDDVEILAYHGIAECFARPDRWFASVVVTDGAGSPRTGLYQECSDADMRVVRRREQRKAAYVGEYGIQVQLNHASAVVKDPRRTEVVDDLLALLSVARPKVVYLHNPADKHDTHVATMLRALEAFRRLPRNLRPEKVYGCEVWRSLDWLQDNEKVALPVSALPNLAASLVGVFDSQISGGKRYDLATVGRRVANATFFASHDTDGESALTYALDLTPVVREEMNLREAVMGAMDRFRNDVLERLARY